MKKIMLGAALCGATLLAGCASDFVQDPSRPTPTRAVENPVDQNSADSEVHGPAQGQVPLVTVSTPTGKQDGPQVRTIVDDVRDTINPPVTPTGTAAQPPATTTPPPVDVRIQKAPVDPVTGE